MKEYVYRDLYTTQVQSFLDEHVKKGFRLLHFATVMNNTSTTHIHVVMERDAKLRNLE